MPTKRPDNDKPMLPRGVSVPRETGEPKGVIEVNGGLAGEDEVNARIATDKWRWAMFIFS